MRLLPQTYSQPRWRRPLYLTRIASQRCRSGPPTLFEKNRPGTAYCNKSIYYLVNIWMAKAPQAVAPQPAPSLSAADEIEKLASLLERGILTQEEFDAKKKQLLGL